MPRRIGVLLFQNVQALDVVGPTDAFAAAVSAEGSASRVPSYEVFTVAASSRVVVSESGVVLKPHYTFDSCPDMDTLLIPGGCGIRDPRVSRRLAPWIAPGRAHAAHCRGLHGDVRPRGHRAAAQSPRDYALALRPGSGGALSRTAGGCQRALSQGRPLLYLGRNYLRHRSRTGPDRRRLWASSTTSGRARAGGVPATRWRPGTVFRAARIRSEIDRSPCGPQPVDSDQPPPEDHSGNARAAGEPRSETGRPALQGDIRNDACRFRRKPADEGGAAAPCCVGCQHQACRDFARVSQQPRLSPRFRAPLRCLTWHISGAFRGR